MELSIIIPTYNEAKKIAADIEAAAKFLLSADLDGEIIIVDDGSKDDTADTALQTCISPKVTLRIARNEVHHGKGFAVRTGIKASKGKYVAFVDSGCCVPYDNLLRGLELLKSNSCNIAHGSRKLQQSTIYKGQSIHRRICAVVFRWFVNKLIKIDPLLTDTQCGFKIYQGDIARELYSQCITDGFMFDIEVILRAQTAGCKINEFPIEWTCDIDSRLSPTRSFANIVFELITIKRKLGKK
jgi:dolichyl-phosphate beta-glucosyltransferase